MLEHMGYLPEVSTSGVALEGADRVILPGVRAWDAGVTQLDRCALHRGVPPSAVYRCSVFV